MPRIHYMHQATLNGGHQFDVECEIECTVEYSYGDDEPDISIDGVWLSDEHGEYTQNAAKSEDAFFKALGAVIANAVQSDADFLDEACEASGLSYHSQGSNDPQAYWRAA